MMKNGLLLLSTMLLIAGCQHRAASPTASVRWAPSLGLVTMSERWPDSALSRAGWEEARNDFYMAPRPSISPESLAVVEVHTHERSWTTNGRPREHSRTETHAFRARIRR